ncbi:MAG: cell division protein SepF [Actinomycetia bacterium]|nr:cell division protein SepF [Actinomycetes bacterium]
MSKWMDSAREFLGLGEDPYYDDDYNDPVEGDVDDYYDEPLQRSVPGRSAEADWDEGDGGVRMISTPPSAPVPVAAAAPPADRGVVRPLPGSSKPEVVSPTRFDDVQDVADAFKKVQPVIINLQGVDKDLSRRLIDFASGLCYGLEGEMERVAEQVFLLTPKGAEVSDDDRRRLAEGNMDEYDA